ncbi:transmembrane protein, putative [Bodo saltans]|uniref:Transmembrane protein, putative n=1 Tax=Bodo saltans TaxID=75058 RepID=A0A0S4J580_BODSA|nr:transmembrane protein, putative [Bodo saltans]|eukprot:CUG82349.1 transmembrane protein, putative [Bodo saltans]
MFSRTTVKRYTTQAATSFNHSGSSGSTGLNVAAFIGGIMVIPSVLIGCNIFPSTRRPSQVPMYTGSAKHEAKYGKQH